MTNKKKYTILYDIEKKGSDCLFYRQYCIEAYNETQAKNDFIQTINMNSKGADWKLHSIQDVMPTIEEA